MIAGKNATIESRGGLFKFIFRFCKKLLGLCFGNFVGVVRTVERCEALEVYGRPGMFPLEEFINFTL